MTMIGIISLAGVVVNNAIVLIDYTNQLRKRRREELNLGENDILPAKDLIETAVEGGKTRLRPVLLTAITTILGLIPLAIGFNINFLAFLKVMMRRFLLVETTTCFLDQCLGQSFTV